MEKYIKDELIKELKNVAKKMQGEPDPFKKIYYYSAAYGIVDRTMRYNFNKDLLLTYTVLNVTYNSYIERLKAMRAGDKVIPLSPEQLEKTATLVDDLAKAFKSNADVCDILKDIALLAYMSSGPGYYLQTNGAFEGMIP